MLRVSTALFWLQWLLVAAPSWGSGEQRRVVSISLDQSRLDDAPAEVRASAETVDASGSHLTKTADMSLGGVVRWELDGSRLWRVRATGEGLWSAPRIVAPDAAPRDLVLELLPTGRLAGKLEVPRHAVLPTEVTVGFISAVGSEPAIPAGSEHCVVNENLECDCEVPAGTLDLRMRAPGYAPDYRWAQVVPAGGVAELGNVRLFEGGSVSGWVLTEGAEVTEAPRVRLEPWLVEDPQIGMVRPDEERISRRSLGTRVDDQGFFQIRDLPTGSYALIAEAGPAFAVSRVGPIEVDPLGELQLAEPVVLRPPVALALLLEPPVDAFGRNWRIALAPLGAGRESAAPLSGSTDLDGTWERYGVQPGDYLLNVRDVEGSQWISERLTVGAEDERLEFEIPLVPLEGRIIRGDEPLEATIWFGTARGAQRIRFQSDSDGSFGGYLPREGKWRVSLREAAEGLRQQLPAVVVERAEGDPVAEVEIRIPNTRLDGVVVDVEQRPVGGAIVDVTYLPGFKEGAKTFASSDSEGRFTLRGLPEGLVWVQARAQDTQSEKVTLSLEEDEESEEVRLVLEKRNLLRGELVSPYGVVAGALVLSLPFAIGGPVAIERAITGVDGHFEVPLPKGTGESELLILAPGLAGRLFRAMGSGDERARITLSTDGGALRLRFDASKSEPWLFKAGARAPASNLRAVASEARSDGFVELTVPLMEPGDYALCESALGPVGGPCAQGSLIPGDMLSLEIPSSRPDAAIPADSGAEGSPSRGSD